MEEGSRVSAPLLQRLAGGPPALHGIITNAIHSEGCIPIDLGTDIHQWRTSRFAPPGFELMLGARGHQNSGCIVVRSDQRGYVGGRRTRRKIEPGAHVNRQNEVDSEIGGRREREHGPEPAVSQAPAIDGYGRIVQGQRTTGAENIDQRCAGGTGAEEYQLAGIEIHGGHGERYGQVDESPSRYDRLDGAPQWSRFEEGAEIQAGNRRESVSYDATPSQHRHLVQQLVVPDSARQPGGDHRPHRGGNVPDRVEPRFPECPTGTQVRRGLRTSTTQDNSGSANGQVLRFERCWASAWA